jgi:cell division protein FtsQ
MRGRNAAVAKDKRRKRRLQAERMGEQSQRRSVPRGVWPMLMVVAIALIVVAIYRLVPDDALPVKRVIVTGELNHLDRAAIEQTAMPYVTTDFFSVDLQAIEQAVGAMPWVYQVAVRRVWPDTLEIHILEQEPVARWGDKALLNPYGDIFSPKLNDEFSGLPMIYGPESRRHELIRSFLEIYHRLSVIGLQLKSLVEDRRGSWGVGISNGLHLSLGQREQESRLGRFIQAYPGLIAERKDQVQRIDLRYSNGLAIAWKQQLDGPTARKKGD